MHVCVCVFTLVWGQLCVQMQIHVCERHFHRCWDLNAASASHFPPASTSPTEPFFQPSTIPFIISKSLFQIIRTTISTPLIHFSCQHTCVITVQIKKRETTGSSTPCLSLRLHATAPARAVTNGFLTACDGLILAPSLIGWIRSSLGG